MKYLLKLRYVGTGFSGFQVQPGKRTVQSSLGDAIEEIFKVRYDVKGCSRTDSGVHANVYFATFDVPDKNSINITAEKLPFALNSVLDNDITVTGAKIVSDTFHVRHDVVSKEYVYIINCDKFRDPFEHNRAFFYPHQITDDMVEIMNKAGEIISGKHDFKCFMASGASVSDTCRDVKYIKAERTDENHLKIYACADGFLYNMVRIIAGTLLEAARGKITVSDIKNLLDSNDRTLAGPTLPACGLYLNKVNFKNICI